MIQWTLIPFQCQRHLRSLWNKLLPKLKQSPPIRLLITLVQSAKPLSQLQKCSCSGLPNRVRYLPRQSASTSTTRQHATMSIANLRLVQRYHRLFRLPTLADTTARYAHCDFDRDHMHEFLISSRCYVRMLNCAPCRPLFHST